MKDKKCTARNKTRKEELGYTIFLFYQKNVVQDCKQCKCNYNCDVCVCVCVCTRTCASMYVCVLLCLTVSCMPQYLLIPVVHMCMHTCACMQTPIAIAHYKNLHPRKMSHYQYTAETKDDKHFPIVPYGLDICDITCISVNL